MTEIVTERLHMRLFRPEDFEAHARINADPEVMRFLPPGPMTRVEAWRQMAQYVGHWQLRGYGMWAVVERSTGELVGRIGLLNPEGGLGFEVGWALARRAWGKGFAIEGAQAAVRHAFSRPSAGTTSSRSFTRRTRGPSVSRSVSAAHRSARPTWPERRSSSIESSGRGNPRRSRCGKRRERSMPKESAGGRAHDERKGAMNNMKNLKARTVASPEQKRVKGGMERIPAPPPTPLPIPYPKIGRK